jgi:predicted GIY-YIG superfamily endonuclease
MKVEYIWSMNNDMCFIYALSYNNNVFYIGITKDMAARYLSHIRGHECLRVSSYIKDIIKKGDIPIMRPLEYLPNKEAKRKESDIIKLFTKAGHNLLNDVHTYIPGWSHERLPSIIDRHTMIAHLQKIQQIKESIHLFWIKHEQATTN